MGCNKSKPQYRGNEAETNSGQTNPWGQSREAHLNYGENFELNQNGVSDVGLSDYQPSGDQFTANSGQQTGYGYSNSIVTGSFGNAAPVYYPNSGFNNMQYLNTNNYTVYNHGNFNGLSASTNSAYNNNISQEQFQNLYIQHQYQNQPQCLGRVDHESIMGPPSRPISRPPKSDYNKSFLIRPLVRCRSFSNDSRRARQTIQYNDLVRHSSLENIPTFSRFRGRHSRNNFASDSNLSSNSSVGDKEYCRGFRPRWRYSESQRQRGLKRNSWDEDSLSSNSTASDIPRTVTENDTTGVEPRVKRRPSDNDPYNNNSADESNNNKNVEVKEIICNNKTKNIDDGAEQLNLNDAPFDILDLLIFPEEWSSCAVDQTGFVNISLTSPEGMSVQKYFSRSSQSKDFKLSITALARIENPFMHSHYLLKKLEMESRNEHVDELYLYHGTKTEHLTGILENNLNWRLYSEKHRFGQGISFSPLATYSSHYSDKSSEKVMLLFKVLTSNSVAGSPDMVIPPIIDDVVYDVSIKDDTTVIVKYSDNEFYPLYKIMYSKIMRN